MMLLNRWLVLPDEGVRPSGDTARIAPIEFGSTPRVPFGSRPHDSRPLRPSLSGVLVQEPRDGE